MDTGVFNPNIVLFMRSNFIPAIVLLAGCLAGNKLFNHVNAWLGIAIIIATIIYFLNKLIKFIKNEKDSD